MGAVNRQAGRGLGASGARGTGVERMLSLPVGHSSRLFRCGCGSTVRSAVPNTGRTDHRRGYVMMCSEAFRGSYSYSYSKKNQICFVFFEKFEKKIRKIREKKIGNFLFEKIFEKKNSKKFLFENFRWCLNVRQPHTG